MQGFTVMNLSIVKQIILARRKPLLCLAAVIAITLSARIFISVFQEPQLERARAEWVKLRAAESRGVANISKEMIYNNGKNDLGKLRERIYSKNQFARFIGEIYDAAGRNNVELASITYKPELNKEEMLFKYSMTLSTSGRYIQQKKFIRDLNLADNLLHIDSISLAIQGSSSDMVQLQTQITTYFRVEAQ
jgi:hypothetical protein